MILKVILVLMLFINMAHAGTMTGCSGDQWSGYDKNRERSNWVYRTNRTWEIGFSGYERSGCDRSVSAKNNSKTKVFMKNGTCTYQFNAKTAKLMITNSPKAKCECKGVYVLEKTCNEGENEYEGFLKEK